MTDSETECCQKPTFKSLSKCQLFVNFLVGNLFIGPVMLVYWVCTWQLITSVLFLPNDQRTSIWISFAVAVGGVFILSSAQRQIHRLANAYGVVWWVVCSRLYAYVTAFVSVNQWRCFWQGWDIYTSTTTANGLATCCGAFFILCLLRCSAIVLAAPCFIAIDLPSSSFFVMPTYGNTQPDTVRHILDSLLIASIIPFLNATVWRGAWVVWDRNLYPDHLTTSALLNLLIAYVMAGFLIVPRAKWMGLCAWAEDRHWLGRYLVEDLHTWLQAMAVISYWRGFWTLLIDHVLCGEELRYWLGHVFSFALMTVCLASKSLSTLGCFRDGVLSNGEGIDLDFYYVTKMWTYWKRGKYRTLDEDKETKIDVRQDEAGPVLNYSKKVDEKTGLWASER